FADGDGGADVADDEVFDGHFIRAGITDDIRKGFVDAEKALGDGRLRGRGDGSEVDGFVAVAVYADEAVSGTGEGGGYVEDSDDGAHLMPSPVRLNRLALPAAEMLSGVLSTGSRVSGNKLDPRRAGL